MGINWSLFPIGNNIPSHADYNAALDTAYKELADKLYDDYNAQDKSQFISDFQDRADFLDMAGAARGLLQYYGLNLQHGGTGPENIDRGFPGEDWDNPYSFNYSTDKKRWILQNLGCDAKRDDMCGRWAERSRNDDNIEHTLFNLSLCSSYYRDLEGREPFVWNPDGSLTINDRYGFTDLQDFSPAITGSFKNFIQGVGINLFGRGVGSLLGSLNENTLPDKANSMWNLFRKEEYTDYNADPYFYWRGHGTDLTGIIVSMSRDANGVVTVTTSSPHGLDTISGDGGDGVRISSGNVNGWDDRTGAKQPQNGNAWHNPNGVNVNVTGANTFTYVDYGGSAGHEGGTSATAMGTSTAVESINASFISSNNIKVYQMKRWGRMRHMYTSDTFGVTDILAANPKLLFDAIARGTIPYSVLPNYLAQGAPASSPLPETTAGGPHAPDKQSLPSLANNWTTGASGNYPKPWMSASQKITNSNYTWVGAYARLLGPAISEYSNNGALMSCWKGSSEAVLGEGFSEALSNYYTNDNGAFKGKGIYGRIGLLQSGQYAGHVGFFPQDWYDQNQGTYNGAFWSARFDPPLADHLVWRDPAEWWDSVTKKTIQVRYGTMMMNVEVAFGNPDFGDDDYYLGKDLKAYPDYSLDVTMLSVMVATAALARWL